jgi:hypothetical protein
MRDPHVVALRYRLETDSSLTFDNPQPRDHDYNEFSLHLADGTLTCAMKAHYASAHEARAVVDPVLRAWEIDVALQRGSGVLWFVFEQAEIVDRDPPPPGSPRTIDLSTQLTTKSALSAGASLSWREYPPPPARFTVSPDVETLWHRYEGYVQGREPLLSMVSACLTWLTAQVRGRANVAKTYAIDLAVLRKLDDFAANLGDERTARKFHARSERREPTAPEAAWINAAIRMIIHRVGEHAADPTAPLSTLGMSDLPPL